MLESLFIKFQAWHLFWRTSVNDCFCIALAPLIVTYPFYFIFSTFFLIITATTVNISEYLRCLFLAQIQKASKNLNLVSHFHWSHFHCCYFLFPCFFLSFSVLFHFLSLLIKRILLSWELIKMFLPPTTSLKYVHVSK